MRLRAILLALSASIFAVQAAAEEMKMAVTTSFANSGLADFLLPQIKRDTGIDVQLLVVGTGQALKLAEAGDVDAVLVHARAAEEAFVEAGFATHRREIMYNDFVLVGPSVDPAGAGRGPTVSDALVAIEQAQARFVSRGDESGTHKRELALWDAAGITPEGEWYNEVGQGMGAALNTAAGMNAYILTDRASWLNFGNKGDLALLYEGDEELINQYAYLPVNAELHSHVNADAAAALESWLTGYKAKVLINSYKIEDQQLFTFNARPLEGGEG